MQVTTTQKVIAAMMVEGTGRHMLDSGGAYGRHWEQNQKALGTDPDAAAELLFSGPGIHFHRTYGLTVSTPHFMDANLEYAPEVDKALHLFADQEEWARESWPAVLEAWIETTDYTVEYSENTYNGESLLSQVLQYWALAHPTEDHVVLVQLHNGADVRGGYTAPRAFHDLEEYALAGDGRITAVCSHDPASDALEGMPPQDSEPHSWDSDDAGYSFYPADSETQDFKWEEGELPSCPVDGSRVYFHAWPVDNTQEQWDHLYRDPSPALDALRTLAARLGDIDDALQAERDHRLALMQQARSDGESVDAIAKALNISRQRAHALLT